MNNVNVLLQDILNLTEHCLQKSVAEIQRIGFKTPDRQKIYIACLYSRILELMHDSLQLVKTGTIYSLPILLRSALETSADFKNLLEKPDYWQSLLANSLNQQRKLGEAYIKNPQNPFSKNFSNCPDSNKRLTEINSELMNLKNKGYKPLSIEERHEMAKMSDDYDSFFRLLCVDVHTHLLNLQQHICTSSGYYKIKVMESPASPEDIFINISPFLDILLFTSEKIFPFLSSGVSFEEERIKQQDIINKYINSGCNETGTVLEY